MALLERQAVKPAPAMDSKVVSAPELGGDVMVRGMTLSQRLSLNSNESGQVTRNIPRALAYCVLADDGLPVYTEAEWETVGTENMELCIRLFTVASQLSALTEGDVEKKSESAPT